MKTRKSMLRSYSSAEAAAGDPPRLETRPDARLSTTRVCAEFEPENLGLVSVDGDGRIIEANRAFGSMSGYSPDDLPLDMAAITPAEWQETDDLKARQLADDGQCLPWQKQILTRQGHRLPVLIGALEPNPTGDGFRYFVANIEGHVLADSAILEYQSTLRRASVEFSLSAERERRAIAEELHDGVGQDLAIAKLRLSRLREETGGHMRTELDAIAAQVSNALGSCRTLSHALATPALYELGLVPALKNLIAALNQDNRLRIAVHIDDGEFPLTATARIILYRIIRELMINVVKHAQASKVEISVTREQDKLKVVISDDGVGFNVRETVGDLAPGSGFGLFLVRERLRHIGGSFDLESTIGKGTRATVMAALDDTENPHGATA